MDFLWVALASLLAGFVDAIVGGGGLILVPALFIAYPQAHAATLLGTNKSASIWGTAMAAWRYGRQVDLKWGSLWPAALCGFLGSLMGAWMVTFLSTELLRKFLNDILNKTNAVINCTLFNSGTNTFILYNADLDLNKIDRLLKDKWNIK